MDVKVKSFYEKAWFAWLMVLLFFPVGLVLLWKYSHSSTWVRGSISFIFAVMIMSSLITNILNPEKSSAKTDEKKVTASVPKANETKSTSEVPKENVTTGSSPESNLKNEQEAFKRYDKEYSKQLEIYSDITKKWKNIFHLLGNGGIGQQEALMQLRECEKNVRDLQGGFSSIKIPGELKPEHQKLLSLSLEKMNISLSHYLNKTTYGIKWTETKGDKEWIKKMESESSLADIFMVQSMNKYVEAGKALNLDMSNLMNLHP